MRSLVFGLVALLCQTASGEPLQVTLVSLSPHEPAQRTPLTTLTVDPRKRVRLQSTNVSLPPWTLEKTWDPSTLYKLEVQVGKSIRVVQVPLCRLQASRFQETLTLHLNARGDGVIHADLLVPATSCAPGILTPKSRTFKTTIELSSVTPGKRPLLESMPDTPDGQPPPQTSFLTRYWYYIVPLVIVMLLPVGEAPPGAGSGSGGQAPSRRSAS